MPYAPLSPVAQKEDPTEEWLARQYVNATPGSIGSSLLAVWNYCDDDILSRFRTASLSRRLQRVMMNLDLTPLEDLSQAFQLLGATWLVGVDVSTRDVRWPSAARIDELTEYARPTRQTLEVRVIQLFLGLRRMCMLRADPVRLPFDLGNEILTQWRAAAAVTPRQQSLNEWMIDWLVRCSGTNWTLVGDPSAKPPIARQSSQDA